MAVLNAGRYSFTTPHGKTIGAIVVGGCLLSYYALVNVNEEARLREPPKPPGRHDYTSTDAVYAVTYPAKNANVKGAQPSASKFV
ncbi:hypothetical protein JR316_0008237 [Psilocybe cubensis]|uniref:Uncharacterized protein n=2 Tax=Psilocybe cubensis TaxID=181762 RepID=A0A8H7XTC9_PSICU|nr:hypothetical protein JR316_0008237 [Psilocybe cubensis]KAH9479642.1 hypothetical protein JR316_0008237 [Psilocybe cubensis]